jgi:hypothetical protein
VRLLVLGLRLVGLRQQPDGDDGKPGVDQAAAEVPGPQSFVNRLDSIRRLWKKEP